VRKGGCARGFATALVLWAVAIAAITLAGLQIVAARQSAAGREALARVRAQWAARAGVEGMIARLSSESGQAQPLGASSLLKDLATVAQGSVGEAAYLVASDEAQGVVPGAADAHAKINVNLMSVDDLMLLPGMSEDIAEAIIDWIDADDTPGLSGAELETYGALASAYRPRNGPVRRLAELELVKGVDPLDLRGEDWNLNGRLDPGENDGDLSWPPDNADGKLDAGWSGVITADSVTRPFSAQGLATLDLLNTDAAQLASELGISQEQAQTIVAYATGESPSMAEFIRTPLSQTAQQLQRDGRLQLSQPGRTGRAGRGGGGGGGGQVQVADLTRDQLALLLERTSLVDPLGVRPGKLNVNTASEQTLEYLSVLTPTVRDALLALRDSKGGDIERFTDLLDAQGMDNQTLASLYNALEVRSSVFVVTSRGRDGATGVEVEIVATIDRSADPVVIRSMVVR
jgi:DNA uptake protein ComE-like DNA-binding protein